MIIKDLSINYILSPGDTVNKNYIKIKYWEWGCNQVFKGRAGLPSRLSNCIFIFLTEPSGIAYKEPNFPVS